MIGQKLAGRYEIVSEIGRGGMGVVYKSRDPLLDRDVAIKIITPGLLTPDIEQRFRIEAKVVARMDHPSIVSIHDFGRHEGSMFFVMPLVEGDGLHKLIRERALRLGDIIDIGIAVADALAYSHAREVIHRDIKPENIMVARDDDDGLRVRVMDFGLARRTKVSAMTKTGVLIGTASYVSPEQISGQLVDARADIYSLGTVLYHCVTNDVPFTGELQAVLYRIVHEAPQSLRSLGADIDEEFEGLILSCLAKELEARPRGARELKQQLVDYRSRLHKNERMKSVSTSRVAQHVERSLSPFVDRTAELAELQRRLNQSVAGECQFVVLSGEPGVGKTRLLEEIENLANARRIRVLHGRFVERDAAFPYHGFCETIQDYFRRRETDISSSEPPDFSDIGNDLIALFPMLSEIQAIRTSSGENSLPTQPIEAGSPLSRNQIFELLARTLTRLAGGQPLVLFLEDLHGAELSLEALLYIFRRLGPTPTLIVGTYRSTEVDRRHPLRQMLDNLRGDRRFESIALNPFSPADHHRYLLTLVGGNDIGEGLATRLYEASEGNPFFTKELLRSLFDSGGVTQDDRGAWALSGEREISPDMLPATIQQAVETRMGRLPEDLLGILSIASVMGKSFDFRDLEKLAGERDDLDDAVERLISEGLIEEDRRSRGDRLTFSSGVVREVMYASLSRRKRRSLHRRYANELERRYKGRLERAYPQLVHHFYEGDVPEKTVEYGLLQARKALDAFGADEAVRAAKTALEFLDEEWEGQRSVEAEARVLLGAGLDMGGDVARALDQLETAIDLFTRGGQTERAVETMLAAAQAAWKVRRIEPTWRWVECGLEAARNVGAKESLAKLLSLAATLSNLRGEHAQASDYVQEAERLTPSPDAKQVEREIPRGGTLVATLAHFAATEPAAIQLIEEAEVYSNVFETLVATNEDGNLIPSLAESWETPDGGRSFEFRLRSGVRFQDGSPLIAADVRQSWEGSIRRVVPNLAEAFGAIQGFREFVAGKQDGLPGLEPQGDDRLLIRLDEPLPIFPALLSDPRTAVTRRGETDADELLGSGPFRLTSRNDARVVLEDNADYWKGRPPNVDRIEFRLGLGASAIATGLRDGTFDLARDLRPQDLDEILRDRRWRGRVVEVALKTTYFFLFNARSGPVGGNEALRRALSGVVRTRDLVWRTLGRFAQPATGFLPPGILGHDPGRRPHVLSTDEARELLRSSGMSGQIVLRAAVHPVIADRYRQLLDNLFTTWAELGVEVDVSTPDISSFLDAWENNDGIDVWIGRWIPDYNDPDNFTHTLFHSESGQLRRYFSSLEVDRILENARVEREPAERERMYHRFERCCRGQGVLTPLFHDVDYRVAGPKVCGMRLSNTPPHVNYAELGKSEHAAAERVTHRELGGVIRVPLTGRVVDLDPALANSDEQNEVLPSVYETLTRDVGDVRIVPWLAAEFDDEEGGKRYRFRLRDDVHFHDGRKLTSRDVRYSFERLLLSSESKNRWQYAVIRGARDLLRGRTRDLAGLRILSAEEFVIELERPVSFFPGLLAFTPASIVPEGTARIGDSWQSGAVGTGPFRVTRFDAQRGLELERNPSYWRQGHPRSQGVAFSFDVSPRQILDGFRAGRFSLASDLFPADVEALRRDSEFAASYRETPRLSTYYAAFNIHRGPLTDDALRLRIVKAVEIAALVQRTLQRVAIPAEGLIPPGLLGHDPAGGVRERTTLVPVSSGEIKLVAAVHPVFTREYAAFYDRLTEALNHVGIRLEPSREAMGDLLATKRQAEVDLALVQWVADYPDADSFVNILQTDAGFIGPLCGSPEIDELIERGRAETDPDLRHSIYRRVEETIMREARLLPLFHEQVYRFARPEIEGLSVSYLSPAVAYDELSIHGI